MSGFIVYVDGFNLYHGLHQRFRRQYLWLDLVALSRRLRPRDQLVKVRYFTAQVLNDPDAMSRQEMYLQALQAHNGDRIEIIKGRYKAREVRCWECDATWTRYEEKETDVNIAVSLVADVATGKATSAVIISGDSDLVPAVKMAHELNPDADIVAAFPPERWSHDLKRLLPDSDWIRDWQIRRSLLPDEVKDPNTGYVIKRPEKWR